MTTTTWSVQAIQTTNAEFRAWGKAISDALTAIGMTKVTDSGQIDWATVAAPGAGSTSMGYEVWSMVDAAQSTCPILMKIEYGSGAAATTPGVWLTVTTSSNGAGTMTGTTIQARVALSLGSADTAPRTGYACHQAGIFWLDWGGVASVACPTLGFGFARHCDASGTIATDGGGWWYKNGASGTSNNTTYYRTTATTRTGMGFCPTPYYSGITSAAYASDVGVFDAVVFSDRPTRIFGLVGIYKADFTAGSSFTATLWGSSRTMMPINGTRGHNFQDSLAQQTLVHTALVYS